MKYNGEFKIEKGKPLPPASSRRRYPFREMAVGDSFFIKCADTNDARRAQINVTGSARQIKVSTRREDGGVRVWRTG